MRRPPRPRQQRRQLLLPVVPVEVLDHQHAQAAKQMHREQEHKAAFGELDQGLIAPAQEVVEPRAAMERQPQHKEMDRQENRQRQA